jgi:hypothetical protein
MERRKQMRNRISKMIGIIAAVALLLLSVGVFNASADDFSIGKKGVVHFNVAVKAGNTVLQPGMYQVQHATEGNDHIIAFKAMEMPAGYRHGNTPVSAEPAARVKCRIEPVAKKAGNTEIVLRTNAAGEKEIAEVQVAGEAFKHLF